METTYVKKEPNEILKEIKRISEMKNSMDRLNKRLETTEKRVGELAYRSIKIIQLRIEEKYWAKMRFQQPHCQ